MVKELATLKDLDSLIGKIASTIQDALYISNITLVLWDHKDGQFKIVKGKTKKQNRLVLITRFSHG